MDRFTQIALIFLSAGAVAFATVADSNLGYKLWLVVAALSLCIVGYAMVRIAMYFLFNLSVPKHASLMAFWAVSYACYSLIFQVIDVMRFL